MNKYTLQLFLLLVPLLICFQNCGAEHSEPGSANDNGSFEFFAYPYKSTPVFYSSLSLYRNTSAPSGILEFQILGSASYPKDLNLQIQYQIRVHDRNGNILCPLYTGTNLPCVSSIKFDCKTSTIAKAIEVEMNLKVGTDESTTNQEFQIETL